MHYVCSDIHGRADSYYQMLNMIGFSDKDELYIIGDVIDRGPDGVDILMNIMSRPNMHMLMGNHEQMCVDAMRDNSGRAVPLWVHNGGGQTYTDLCCRLESSGCERVLDYLSALPDEMDIEVDGRAFHLVHAFPGHTHDERVWARPELDTPNPFSDGRVVIIGHTPVCYFGRDEIAVGGYLRQLSEAGEHLEILYQPGFIAIDCGCGHQNPVCRLACLRLEDLKAFYV